MSPLVIDEPAAAVAAGDCLTARSIADGTTSRHVRRCGWCDYPVEELRRMVDGFNAWVAYEERRGTYRRHDARVFSELPKAEQRRLVAEAQDLEPERQPMAASEAPPAHEPEEEVVPWM